MEGNFYFFVFYEFISANKYYYSRKIVTLVLSDHVYYASTVKDKDTYTITGLQEFVVHYFVLKASENPEIFMVRNTLLDINMQKLAFMFTDAGASFTNSFRFFTVEHGSSKLYSHVNLGFLAHISL